jgi:hypothetical protein
MFKLKTWIDYFLFFIIIVKIVFVISALGHLILSHSTNSRAQNIDPQLVHLKQRAEFIFTVSMAILLIYHFNPRFSNKPIDIDSETSLLFFLFGCVIILTANWSLFIHEAPWYKRLVSIMS